MFPAVLNGQKASLTYEADIKPIIQKHCIDCHHDTGPGPFSLERFEDVKKRAKFIAHLAEIKYMPPWKADPGFRSHRNQRIMTESEIAILKQWADSKLIKGKTKKIKDLELHARRDKPALELTMKKPYSLIANNTDDFRFFHMPSVITKDHYITGIEFIPGNKRQVHHSRIMVDTTNSMQAIDGLSETDPAVYTFQATPLADEFLYGWVPGNFVFRFPKGFGKKIRAASDIILNVHYAPTTKPQTDRSGIKIWLDSVESVSREVKTFILRETHISNQPFYIEANTKPIFYMSSGVIEKDISLLTIQPHAHLLCKSMRAFAITTEGDMIPLIHIPSWDFNWQNTYEFERLVHIPAGSVIIMEGQYDNTEDNVRNPNHPPKDVGYGWRTVDEMMNLIFYYVEYQQGDESKRLEYPD